MNMLGIRWQAMRGALAVPDLRRLNSAYLCGQLAGMAYLVAIGVYAFNHGGASQVGLMTVVRYAPALLAAPFAGAIADRFARRHLLIGVGLCRAIAHSAAAILVMGGAPPMTVYLAIAASGLASAAFEPAKAALLPTLARTPEQLTAANALGASIENVALTVGPALGGLLLAIASVQVVLFAFAAASLLSAFLIWRIEREPRRAVAAPEPGGGLRRTLAGFETIARTQALRTVVGLFALQMLLFGLLNVFVITIALNQLHTGAGGVGWLYLAGGIGGILGGAITANLAAEGLTRSLTIGMLTISGAFLLLAALPNEPIALIAMFLISFGGCYVDVATFTSLQNSIDDAILARAFSVIGTIIIGALLLGGAIAPVLISLIGTTAALSLPGCVALVGTAFAIPTLRRIDAPAPDLLSPLAPLPSPA